MKLLRSLKLLALRWRYPFSLPEEVLDALGISLKDFSNFEEFIKNLTAPNVKQPVKLYRFMPRGEAEAAFEASAVNIERFHHNTLCSYHFDEGRLEILLQFDDKQLLRRIWLKHKLIAEEPGVEIHLN